MTFEQITKDIEKKNFAGIYYLTGEETYFTDKITHLLDEQVLDASEKDFNRDVLYGTETQVGHILNGCKRFPLLAERRLVIVKEAQGIDAKNWDKMLSYFKKPSPTTILVLAFKGKNKGLPKAAVKAIEENKGIHFEMKKMYERDAIKWVGSYIESRGFEAEVGVSDIIVGYLGLHLHHIENELEKIFIYLSAMKDKKLPKSLVYEMINIDKDFNVFELNKALGVKDNSRSHFIIQRLVSNTKLNPPVLIVASLFRFFSDIAAAYSHKVSDVKGIQEAMKVNWYAAQDLATARQKYPLIKVYHNILHILEADLMLKGINPTDQDEEDILKTLIWKLLN